MRRADLASVARCVCVFTLLVSGLGCRALRGPIGERREVPPQHGGVLHMATYVDARTLDPAVAGDTTSASLLQLIFAGLIEYDADGHIVPMLAEQWTMSDDGRRYDFKLHEGIRFQDGEELIADDVKRSIERALHHETPCPQPSFYASIRGYEAFHDGTPGPGGKPVFAEHIEGVVIDGRYLLHIDLSEPDATFLPVLTLATVAPVCRSGGATYTRDWANHSCGAGPFKLREWQTSREVVLTRHAGYFQPGKPYLDEIRWLLVMPQLTQRFKFEEGALDHIRDLTFADHVGYLADPRWDPYRLWEPAKVIQGVFLNTQMKPFDDVELRRAVASAIDWDQFSLLRPRVYVRAHQMVPPAIAGPDDGSFAGQVHDPVAALRHMDKAGYPYDPATRRGGYPEIVRYLGLAGRPGEMLAQMVQQDLAKIGIRMEMKMVSWPTFLAEAAKPGSAQLGYGGWSMDFPDPSDFFEPILASSSIHEEETQNFGFYRNRELDALLKKAHSETDRAIRAALYRRCEEIVRDDVPWAIGINQQMPELMQPYVHGYHVSGAHDENVRDVWIDSSERPTAALRRKASRVLATIRPWGRR
jgi:ABC-type transport system substrate-binding protein